jgi:hypothetical protein
VRSPTLSVKEIEQKPAGSGSHTVIVQENRNWEDKLMELGKLRLQAKPETES